MSETHWRKLINPDYMGAYSLDNGNGTYKTAVFTIESAGQKDVTGPDGTKKKLVIGLRESSKPMILNSTNSRTLEKLYKTPYIEEWIGRKFEVGVENVKVGPNREDALRIKKHLPQTSGPVKCADCEHEITDAGSMKAAQVAAYARKRFGLELCAECMKKRDAAKRAAQEPEEKTGPADTSDPAVGSSTEGTDNDAE